MATSREIGDFLESKLARLLDEYEERIPASIVAQGYEELRFIREAYDSSFVFGKATGLPTPIVTFSVRWRKLKVAKNWDSRRGWAKTTGLGAAVGNTKVLRETATGFYFDLTRVNKRLRNYWKDFNRDKAKGSLLQFKAGVDKRMRDRARRDMEPLVKQILGAAAQMGGSKQVVRVIQKLELPLAKFKRNRAFRSRPI